MTQPSAQHSLWISLRTYTAARLAIASVVLIGYSLVQWRTSSDFSIVQIVLIYGLVYSLGGIVFAWAAARVNKLFDVQVMLQMAWDMLAIAALLYISGGTATGLGLLFLIPVAATALLTRLLMALFSAAVASLIVLLEVLLFNFANPSTEINWLTAGLHGLAFFMGALLTSRLAQRALNQEEVARTASAQLARQYAVNELVVAQLEVPVLVVQSTLITLANSAAQTELGTLSAVGLPAPTELLELIDQWQIRQQFQPNARPDDPSITQSPLLSLFANTQGSGSAVSAEVSSNDVDFPMLMNVMLAHQRSATYTVRLVNLPTAKPDMQAPSVLAVLQNIQKIEDRAQELKLASMGRLTASIAHEIRNPLAAIAHAASLISEDLQSPAQSNQTEQAIAQAQLHKRLTNIMLDNTQRLNRMVEDILLLSRKERSQTQQMTLAPLVQALVDEQITQFPELHNRLKIDIPSTVALQFDPEHLRRVLLNLVTNARRYASSAPHAIQICALQKSDAIWLWVADDGPPIRKDVLEHLFEPFFTTHSKGTGLGLYITRELCLYNHAQLHYNDPEQGAQFKGFVITQPLYLQPPTHTE